MICTLLVFGGRLTASPGGRSGVGIGAGSALQFGMQMPVVLRLVQRLRIEARSAIRLMSREVARNFGPVFISRGVVQISAYVDALLASLLPTGAVTGLMNAQVIYMLPVSLFGMSISAAELPVMSSAMGSAEQIAVGASRADRFGDTARGILHRAVGGGVPGVRRPDRGRTAANRPIHS